MSNVSDYSFYGGGGFGGINKGQEPKTIYVPMAAPVANKLPKLPNKMVRSLGPRVYKVGKKRTHKKKKSVSKLAKKTRKVTKKHKKSKKASTKESKFQNF